MKLARNLAVAVLLIGFAAFNLTDRTEPTSFSPLLVLATEAQAETVSTPSITAATRAVSRATATRGNRSRGSRRFRDYNRYPGPIPTPEEWKAPEGPVKIALQAGHWKANEAPPELSGLKDNGTKGGGKMEWEVNLSIARKAAVLLEAKGYVVDVLPAVVPPDYRAHLFIAIHADGAADERASGFRVAAPRRDATGRAERMAAILTQTYQEATGLKLLPDVTRRMENYYAFNFRRYEHALHPMTIAVILETGFLTSPKDRLLIVDDQDRVARGIVDAVLVFPETGGAGSGIVERGGH